MNILLFDPCYNKYMKYINLTQGFRSAVDDADFEWLNQWRWCISTGYASRGVWDKLTKKVNSQKMHRMIMGNPTTLQVDHIDGNKLNNQRNNLRLVTPSGNAINRKIRSDNTTGSRGVRYRHQYNLYQARICKEGRRVSLGHFKTQEEATKAYNNAATEWHGELART